MEINALRTKSVAVHGGSDGTHEIFCVNVNLYIKTERRDQFIDLIKKNEIGTLNEPLAIQYFWGENINEKNLFHFQEQFKGKIGFDEHKLTPHFRAWEEFASNEDSPFAKSPEVFTFFKSPKAL